mmetsp:Transcript_23173/g.28479  ORF Transcript_23173/g.28479 Transcript_23173/m.28479 type:complete len:521 (+) Transcript_23173:187-1749(+)
MQFWRSKGVISQPLTLKDLLNIHELLVDKNDAQNIFQKSKSVRGHFSKSKTLMQELQAYIDAENNSSRINPWRLDALMKQLGDIRLKPLAVEIDISDVDIAVDVDKMVLQLKSFLWRIAKARHNTGGTAGNRVRNLNRFDTLGHELKKIHQISNVLNFCLESFKSFVQSSKVLVTGAFTGGKCPAYELCIKDLDVAGVTDAMLVNFRLGGQLPTLIKYVDSFLRRLGVDVCQNSNEAEKKFTSDVFSRAKEEIMTNLDLFQFFFEISTATIGENKLSLLNDEDVNVDDDAWLTNKKPLILSIRGKRGDPRPPLSLHVRGTVVETLDLIQGKVKKNAFVPEKPGDSGKHNDDDQVTEGNGSGNGIEVYEICMQLVHNQGIIFPALPTEILAQFTVKQQQSHAFYLARLILLNAISSFPGSSKSTSNSNNSGFVVFSASRKISLAQFENLVLLSGELFYLSELLTEDDPLFSNATPSTRNLMKGQNEGDHHIHHDSLHTDATDSNESESEDETGEAIEEAAN